MKVEVIYIYLTSDSVRVVQGQDISCLCNKATVNEGYRGITV
jgi:hypothetical protein